MNAEPQKRNHFWWRLIILLVIGIGAAAALLPDFTPCGGGRTSIRNACINNLRQIDGAIEQWALDKNIHATNQVVEAEVAAYIKHGMPTCPGGGKYTIGKVNEPPRCSIHDHVLPPL